MHAGASRGRGAGTGGNGPGRRRRAAEDAPRRAQGPISADRPGVGIHRYGGPIQWFGGDTGRPAHRHGVARPTKVVDHLHRRCRNGCAVRGNRSDPGGRDGQGRRDETGCDRLQSPACRAGARPDVRCATTGARPRRTASSTTTTPRPGSAPSGTASPTPGAGRTTGATTPASMISRGPRWARGHPPAMDRTSGIVTTIATRAARERWSGADGDGDWGWAGEPDPMRPLMVTRR